MILLKNTSLVLLLLTTTIPAFSQTYNPQTESLVWDLGPNDPQIRVQFRTKGLNNAGYEFVAPVITNNFSDELIVKIEFSITDYCGETKVFTMIPKTIRPLERYAPDPFSAGYDYDVACKKSSEYGPANNKEKTRIQRISHRVLTLRNITKEKKAAEEEKVRKEKELELKRQQELEAKQKAEAERKAEEARKADERKKEDARKAEEAKRKAEGDKRKVEAERQQASATSQGQQSQTSGAGSNNSAQQNLLAQQQAERIRQEAERAAEERAAEQAAWKAADEEHTRRVAQEDQRRKEEARRAEEERLQRVQQARIQNAHDAQRVQAATEEVQELQNLDLNHSNIERMEQEYAAKLRQLNVAMNNLEEAKQQQLTSAVQSQDWGSTPYGESVGELMQTTGQLVNSMGEQKRKDQAAASLAYERRKFLERVENEKAQMRFNMRSEMLENFKPWKIPETRESEPTRVYGFYVLYNYNELSAEQSVLSVSNIAEIGTYADGTWPSLLYLRKIEEEANQKFQYAYFHSNAYNTRAEAEQMKQALVQLFSRSGTVSETYIEATINPAGERMDFWETGIVPQK